MILMKVNWLGRSIIILAIATITGASLPIGHPLDAKADLSAWAFSREITISDAGGGSAANYTQGFQVYENVAPIIADGAGAEEFVSSSVYFNGNTYIGSYASNGIVQISSYNEATNILSLPTPVVAIGGGDDHSQPSVSVIQHAGTFQNHILVATSEHSGKMQLYRSVNSENISSFLKANGGADIETTNSTYPHVIETANGTLILFYRYRGNVNYDYYFRTSTDQGDTWSGRTQLTNFNEFAQGSNIYVLFSNNGYAPSDTINIGIRLNYGRQYVDVWHAYTSDGGRIWKRLSDNSTLILPLNQSTPGSIPDLVYETPSTDQTVLTDHQYNTFLTAVTTDLDGNPYLTWENNVTRNTRASPTDTIVVERGWWNGSSWSTESVTNTGGVTIDVASLGEAITAPPAEDSSMNTVYLAGKGNNNSTEIQKWRKISGVWILSENITNNSPGSAFRPAYVRGALPTNRIRVLFDYSTNFTGDELDKWQFSTFAYPGISTGSVISLHHQSRSDFGDIRFTKADGTTLQPSSSQGRPWLDKVDGWMANIWVNVGDIPSGGDLVVRMFWGNPSATNVNDQVTMDSHFYLADGFESGSLDTSKWKLAQGSVSFDSGELQLVGTNATNTVMSNNATNYPDVMYGEFRVSVKATQDLNGSTLGFAANAETDSAGQVELSPIVSQKAVFSVKSNPNKTWIDINSIDETSQHIWTVQWTDNGSAFYRDSLLKGIIDTHVSSVANGFIFISAPVPNGIQNVNWMFIRGITQPLPSVSQSFGAAGDANGDGSVNALDITKIERIITGLDLQEPRADVNLDGNVNALDITKVERIIAGLD